MTVRSSFGVLRRKAHPGQNFANNAFPPQDALICKQRELASRFIISHTPARILLILIVSDGSRFDELRPIFIMITVVDEMVTVPNCFRERR